MKISLQNLKDEDRRAGIEEENTSLHFTISSPVNSDQLPISPTHRLLAMALRRGTLKYHKDLKSLLSGTEYYITIKDENRGDPIFLARRGHGMPKDPTPMTAKGMTE